MLHRPLCLCFTAVLHSGPRLRKNSVSPHLGNWDHNSGDNSYHLSADTQNQAIALEVEKEPRSWARWTLYLGFDKKNKIILTRVSSAPTSTVLLLWNHLSFVDLKNTSQKYYRTLAGKSKRWLSFKIERNLGGVNIHIHICRYAHTEDFYIATYLQSNLWDGKRFSLKNGSYIEPSKTIGLP